MFKIFFFFLICLFTITSCTKDDFSIRIKNNFSEDIEFIQINSLLFNNIGVNKTSKYQPIDEGNYYLDGISTSQKHINGSLNLKGNGTHKWTIVLLPNGKLELNQDK